MRDALPDAWQSAIARIADNRAIARELRPRSVTSREADRDARIPVSTVTGDVIAQDLPWLWNLYHGKFLALANLAATETVYCAVRDRIKINLNIQHNTSMRYECHVDTNPVEGILYCTSHPPGDGGELVVANQPALGSIEEVDQDCTIIHPIAGQLVFFDARLFAHYVRPLTRPGTTRIVAAMNFYTDATNETMRPPDLDDHLFGVVDKQS